MTAKEHIEAIRSMIPSMSSDELFQLHSDVLDLSNETRTRMNHITQLIHKSGTNPSSKD